MQNQPLGIASSKLNDRAGGNPGPARKLCSFCTKSSLKWPGKHDVRRFLRLSWSPGPGSRPVLACLLQQPHPTAICTTCDLLKAAHPPLDRQIHLLESCCLFSFPF